MKFKQNVRYFLQSLYVLIGPMAEFYPAWAARLSKTPGRPILVGLTALF